MNFSKSETRQKKANLNKMTKIRADQFCNLRRSKNENNGAIVSLIFVCLFPLLENFA